MKFDEQWGAGENKIKNENMSPMDIRSSNFLAALIANPAL